MKKKVMKTWASGELRLWRRVTTTLVSSLESLTTTFSVSLRAGVGAVCQSFWMACLMDSSELAARVKRPVPSLSPVKARVLSTRLLL